MIVKGLGKVAIAFAMSFVFANILCFGYNRDAEWLRRDSGATAGVYAPFHYIIKGDEGFAVTRADENGYMNPSANLAERYILCFGNSQTNGVNVSFGERYTDRLNYMLTNGNLEPVRVYAVARGGNTISDLVSGFNALVTEFPNSEAVVMQLYALDSPEEITEAYNEQTAYIKESSIGYLLANETLKEKTVGIMKEWMPGVAYIINSQLSDLSVIDRNAFFQAGDIMYSDDDSIKLKNDRSNQAVKDEFAHQVTCYENVLKELQKEYDGRIIILYHPYVEIDVDGKMNIVSDKYYEAFRMACEGLGIDFCDMGKDFTDAYYDNYTMTYGFWNTRMDQGHLNAAGHTIIAEKLYREYFDQ